MAMAIQLACERHFFESSNLPITVDLQWGKLSVPIFSMVETFSFSIYVTLLIIQVDENWQWISIISFIYCFSDLLILCMSQFVLRNNFTFNDQLLIQLNMGNISRPDIWNKKAKISENFIKNLPITILPYKFH